MGIHMAWNDARRTLSLRLAPGSRMLPPLRRNLKVRLGNTERDLAFEGRPVEVRI